MNEFEDNIEILHIEVGAGRGNFGRLFHPECYLTDKNSDLIAVHHVTTLDRICDAEALPWPENRFDLVIACNPYGFGFRRPENAQKLLEEMSRVLKNNGRILIIGSKRNPYCAPDLINEAVNHYNIGGRKITVTISEIDPQVEYPEYIFETCGFTRTYPNIRVSACLSK